MLFVCYPKILHKHCLQFLLEFKMAPRETENNAYARFWSDKQRAFWYVMVFSGVVNSAQCLSRFRAMAKFFSSIKEITLYLFRQNRLRFMLV